MSGRKNVLVPLKIINNLDAKAPTPIVVGDMSDDIVSLIINAQYQDNVGIQVQWTSADAVGTIAVEASLDYDPRLETGTFYALTFNPALAQPNSDSGGYLINLNQLPYTYYRVTYTRDSGSGTLDAWATSKEV